MMEHKNSQTITKKRHISLKNTNKTHTEFNSRLMLPSPKFSFNIPPTPVLHNLCTQDITASLTPDNTNNINKSESIKLKLQRALSKQLSRYQNLALKDKQKRINNTKFAFFKGNYKVNKNKRQLEKINKKSITEQYRKKDIQNYSNRSAAFIIKQIKPIKLLLNNSLERKTQILNEQNCQQEYKNIVNNTSKSLRKKYILKNDQFIVEKNKNNFERYDDKWYQKDQFSQQKSLKVFFNHIKKRFISKITIKRNKQVSQFEPWFLQPENEDNFTNFS